MKDKKLFECIECGFQNPKYFGKCPQCSSWNSMVEVKPEAISAEEVTPDLKLLKLKDITEQEIQRINSGLEEFDRVLGGGIVPSSLVLIGGEPGVGKSTLLLEISGALAKSGKKIIYYSGEESAVQIKLRATRLKVDSDHILLLTTGTLEDLKHIVEEEKPDILIIDSIQTINSRSGPSISGSVSSMRYVTSQLMEVAKSGNTTVFIIGHINKEGQIAGPKTLEHMVDAVLYFQGEIKSDLRLMRAEKNRFGPVNEIGVFQMTHEGLLPVSDPSLLFIQHPNSKEPGISILPTMSGLRSLLIEIQALVTESPFVGNPRRIAVGFDNYRMSMLISVIEKKLKLPFYKSDVFLNITGGITIKETAADLAIISALISSYKNISIPTDTVIIGEVGLTGEIRPVHALESRMKEAIRHGLTKFIIPSPPSDLPVKDLSITTVSNLYDLYSVIKK